jgi:hypothetical protein
LDLNTKKLFLSFKIRQLENPKKALLFSHFFKKKLAAFENLPGKKKSNWALNQFWAGTRYGTQSPSGFLGRFFNLYNCHFKKKSMNWFFMVQKYIK